MARVLSTRQARMRLVVTIPILLAVLVFVRGWFVMMTRLPDEAVWYDYIAAIFAFVVSASVAITLVAIVGDKLVVQPIKRWINNGK